MINTGKMIGYAGEVVQEWDDLTKLNSNELKQFARALKDIGVAAHGDLVRQNYIELRDSRVGSKEQLTISVLKLISKVISALSFRGFLGAISPSAKIIGAVCGTAGSALAMKVARDHLHLTKTPREYKAAIINLTCTALTALSSFIGLAIILDLESGSWALTAASVTNFLASGIAISILCS